MDFEKLREELKNLPELKTIKVTKPDPRCGNMRVLSGVCEGIHPVFTTEYKRTIITREKP